MHGTWNTAPPLLRQDLEEALADLRATPDDAVDEGHPQPAQRALANAGRILRRMHMLLPIRLEVYPTPDGEVAIVAPGAPRRSVMVLCESSGGALCMVNIDGEHRRARYSTADSLPDGFLRDALNELAHPRATTDSPRVQSIMEEAAPPTFTEKPSCASSARLRRQP